MSRVGQIARVRKASDVESWSNREERKASDVEATGKPPE